MLTGIDKPNHPFWAAFRLLVLMVTLSFVLWLNASHFDETEIRTIIWVFLGAASLEGGVQQFTRYIQDKKTPG